MPDRSLVDQLTGALRFIIAFYEPGQRYLDTEAWKHAEAGGRAALARGEAALKAEAEVAVGGWINIYRSGLIQGVFETREQAANNAYNWDETLKTTVPVGVAIPNRTLLVFDAWQPADKAVAKMSTQDGLIEGKTYTVFDVGSGGNTLLVEPNGNYRMAHYFSPLSEGAVVTLPMPVSPFELYAPFRPTANAIVDEYLRNAEEIRDETQNTDVWGVAEDVLRMRIAEAIALQEPAEGAPPSQEKRDD